MNCRNCSSKLLEKFIDLGEAPPSNAYRVSEDLDKDETYYPLRTYFCKKCFLVQTEDFVLENNLFDSEYAYLSSTSNSWLNHSRNFFLDATDKLNLSKESFVVEIASNDGYLLNNFVNEGIPCLGIEPTASTASIAREKGITIEESFFSEDLSKEIIKKYELADMVCGFNVYAHVPDILDFTKGLEKIIKPNGVVVLEFPHLVNMIKFKQYDTIYHEHFSYLSLNVVSSIFDKCNLKIDDLEFFPTHGGSARVWGSKKSSKFITKDIVKEQLEKEIDFGICKVETFKNGQPEIEKIKDDLIQFLVKAKDEGKKVVGYGAAAKGNTILNFAGINDEYIDYIVDMSELKIGKFTPGSNIEIKHPDILSRDKIDYILILPWNLSSEIISFCKKVCDEKTKYVVYSPELKIIE